MSAEDSSDRDIGMDTGTCSCDRARRSCLRTQPFLPQKEKPHRFYPMGFGCELA